MVATQPASLLGSCSALINRPDRNDADLDVRFYSDPFCTPTPFSAHYAYELQRLYQRLERHRLPPRPPRAAVLAPHPVSAHAAATCHSLLADRA